MARYNREFLVPYLEDVCALQLSKQRILQLIDSSKKEISKLEKTALESVGEPELEEYLGQGNLAGVGSGCLGALLCGGGVVSLFAAMASGTSSGPEAAILPLGLMIAGIIVCSRSFGAEDRENQQIQERNDEVERDHAVKQMAALVLAEPKIDAVKNRISVLEDEIKKVDELLEKQYSINVIPGWYRDLYPAVYLYDWFKNSRADDLDVALNTLVLEQIKDRLDTIIRNQGEMIINQRIMIANQKKSMEQAERHQAMLMAKLNRIEASNEERNMYLSMIEANTAANAYFSAANYLK